ncbi:MAG: hypothetical protein ACJAU6_003981 [Alphaproteobacteria bacterium]|jgi:hypothetical protein
MSNPFQYFQASPEIARLAVMMYARFPLTAPCATSSPKMYVTTSSVLPEIKRIKRDTLYCGDLV